MPEVKSLTASRFDLRAEAYIDCRAGSIGSDAMDSAAANEATRRPRDSKGNLEQSYRLLSRNSGHSNLRLQTRIAITLIEE